MTNLTRSMANGRTLLLAFALMVPSSSWAQAKQKKAPSGAVEIEEITVTAQRREESIQETPISVTALTHIETYWRDLTNFIANNETPGWQAVEGPAYTLVNGSLSFTGIPLQKGTLDLSVFARNMFDRKYRTYGVDFGPGIGFAFNIYGDPRTFGLRLTYNFSES